MYDFKKSLMAELLGWTSQGHDMYCRDLEVISLNSGRVEPGVRSSVEVPDG